MRRLLPLAILLALAVPLCALLGGATAATTYTFANIGEVTGLGPAAVGWTTGSKDNWGTPDLSAIELPDGRIRAYFQEMDSTQPYAIGSAISTDGGASWSMEPGDRIAAGANGVGDPFIHRLADGTYRLFYKDNQLGVLSATSADGLTFAADAGVRIAPTAFATADGVVPYCTGIVALADGRHRMYCTDRIETRVEGSFTFYIHGIYSAISSDPSLLTWTPEPGLRIGPGATGQVDGSHSTVLAADASGAVTLVVDGGDFASPQGPMVREWMVSSADGLTFGTPVDTGLRGSEPWVVTRADGSQVLLYGSHTPTTGSIQNLARITGTTTADSPATPIAAPAKTKTITCMKGTKTKKVTGARPTCAKGWKQATTITCRKGKRTKTVTAVKPACPKGWRKVTVQ